MMIRPHMRRVAEKDIRFFPSRKSFDFRVFLLQPLLHKPLVAFQRMIQRLLTTDPELRQKPSNVDDAQLDLEFVLDQLCHHFPRPQGE